MEIKQFEWKTYQTKMSELAYDLSTGGWIGDYPDPTTFLDMWKEGEGNNRTGWASKEYDGLLRQAALSPNAETRIKLLKQAEDIFLSDHVVIPLFWYTNNYLLHKSVKNWHPLLLNNQPYKFVDLQ